MSILFLLNHQPNPRLLKQIDYLAQKHRVIVLYYRRYSSIINNEITNSNNVTFQEIGIFENQKYLNRFLSYRNAIKNTKKILQKNKIDIIIYNHIDVLIFGRIYNLFYNNIQKSFPLLEIADLRELVFSKGLKGKLYRILDKYLINKYTQKLILTSPSFFENYYSKIYKKSHFILENKPLSSFLPKCEVKKSSSDILRIGLIGGLYRGKTTKLLLDAVKGRGDIFVHIHGKGIDEKFIMDYVRKYDNIRFFGSFIFSKETANIYNNIDIVYSVYDTKLESRNNKLALPNKLYECMYFKTPIIVSKETYLEERVKKLNIGYSIECDNEKQLINALSDFNRNKNRFIDVFNNLNSQLYLADKDYKEFEKFIYPN